MLENTLIYLFISIGCSCLWSLSDIFIPVRNFVAKNLKGFFQKMLLCMECSSFWIGFFVALIFPPFNYFIINNLYLNKLLTCIFGGIITYLFIKILNKNQLL